MISFAEARDRIASEFLTIASDTEYVPLPHAVNRVLAEDVHTTNPLPPFTHATMDGIAVKYSAGIYSWQITGESAAGDGNQRAITEQECLLIMTGARLPLGADTVIPLERISIESNTASCTKHSFSRGENLRAAGSDLSASAKALSRGTLITPARAGLLAACGCAIVPVRRRLNVGIITTGNELIPVSDTLSADKIRLSNNYVLEGLIKRCGHNAVMLGHCADNEAELANTLHTALASGIDILLTTGGVSVGKYDLLPKVFKQTGVQEIFHGIKVKPGKPVFFGKSALDQLVFGLPGNPVSSFVAFTTLLASPLCAVSKQTYPEIRQAILTKDFKKTSDFRFFLRGLLTESKAGSTVTLLDSQSSGSITELAYANCLIQINEDITFLTAGVEVPCLLI